MSEVAAGGAVAAPRAEDRSAASWGTRTVARLRTRRAAESAFALLVYSAFIIWFTWPVAEHLGDTIYGAPGDLTGSIADLRELVQGHHNPFLSGRIPDFNAPEGRAITTGLNIAVWPSISLLYVLALAFGATAAFSIFTFLGYVLSGYAMFLLARRLFGNWWVALIIGFAYAYYPFAVVNGQGHNFFVHGWVFVLIAWRMLELSERPTIRNGVWAAVAVIVAMSWAPYFILMGGVLYAALMAADVVVAAIGRRLRPHLVPQAVGGFLVLGYLAALRLLTSDATSGELRTNSLDALYTYSARPYEYVVPDRSHPLLGDQTASYLQDHIHGSNFSESTLYVGVTILVLALVGFVFALLRRTPGPQRAIALTFAWVAAVAFAFSAPPKVALPVVGQLPTPSWFVFQITSTWRAYSRFVEVFMLALCLLAAYGLTRLAGRVGRAGRIWGIVLLAFFTIAIPVDLYIKKGGGPRTTTLVAPDIYGVLKRQPPGAMAQYPLYPTGYGDYMELFYQDAHGHPMMNGYADSPQEGRDLQLADLTKPQTAPGLASLGIKYVLVPEFPVTPPVQAPGKPGKGFRLIAKGAYGPTATAGLYRVTAKPAGALPTFGTGFGPAEAPPGQAQFRWIEQQPAKVALDGSCSPCRGRLRFVTGSFARPRRLVVRTGDGRVILNRRVVGDTSISVPLSFSRHVDLTFSASPGPIPIAQAQPGSTDPRSVSVFVRDFRFAPR